MIVNKYIQILIILTAFLQVSILSADWEISITGQGADSVGAYHTITLGTSENCSDGWSYGEDQYDLPAPPGDFTNIHFFHLEWYGNEDENGNTCNNTNFSSDFRSIHQNYDLLSWNIRGYTDGLPSDIPINLSWDTAAVDNLSDDYDLFLYIGDNGHNMRLTNTITIDQEELYLNNANDPNIRVLMGACASTGTTTTHYLDDDNDGWGAGDISLDFCHGFAPEGWAPNSDDINDNLFCESNLIDNCNVCDGFNLDLDCAGVCFGDAFEDVCGVCGGDNSSCEDCAGVPNGDSVIDDCGICDSDSFNDCVQDCNGDWGGVAELDECGECGGDGIPDGNCDCEGSVIDCANVCGGTSTIATLCEDTDGDGLGNPGTETEECLDGGRDLTDGCELPDLNLFLGADGSVFYNLSQAIGGFQFNVDGATVNGASGGDVGAAGFMISTNSSIALGFSLTGSTIPAGCGTLVELSLTGDATGLSGIVVSDASGSAIPFVYYLGSNTDLVADCNDEYPDCYYNYYDCVGECGGSIEIDECGECGGSGAVYCGGGNYECNEEDCPDTFNYCLDLHEGANLISFYALPDDVSITNMMLSIEGIATGIIGAGAAANYIETFGWVGSLNTIKATSGYWVIVDDLGELCIQDAIPTNPAIEYNLNMGANLISFPDEGSDSLSAVLPDDIEGSISGIIGASAAAINVNGGWVGSLSSFEGGNGYWVIANENISFSFELSLLDRLRYTEPKGLTFPEGFESYQSTQQAFYFINEIRSESGDDLNDGWIISYNNGRVTGSREWTGILVDLPVMGNDGNSYSEGYLKTGEIPQFKYLDNSTGRLTDLYHTDIPSWENNGIYVLGSVEVKAILPQRILLNAYPNPFNPVTTLSFVVPNEGMLQLSIYNISGQLMKELAYEYSTSGNVEYIWDAANHPSGVYLARLHINNTIYTQKLVLIK